MKKVLFLFAFLFSVGSYALSPALSVCDDDVGITIQKEDVKVAVVVLELSSLELSIDSANADVKMFSSASLNLNNVTRITRFDYKGPILQIKEGVYKKIQTVPDLIFKQSKKKSNLIAVASGGLSEI